jgi:hypothetical protein
VQAGRADLARGEHAWCLPHSPGKARGRRGSYQAGGEADKTWRLLSHRGLRALDRGQPRRPPNARVPDRRQPRPPLRPGPLPYGLAAAACTKITPRAPSRPGRLREDRMPRLRLEVGDGVVYRRGRGGRSRGDHLLRRQRRPCGAGVARTPTHRG